MKEERGERKEGHLTFFLFHQISAKFLRDNFLYFRKKKFVFQQVGRPDSSREIKLMVHITLN